MSETNGADSDRDAGGTPWSVSLFPAGATLPAGIALRGIGTLTAILGSDAGSPLVSIAVPDQGVAELRWMVDKVLRRVRGGFTIGAATLRAADGVPDRVALAVALDLHQATRTSVTLEGLGGIRPAYDAITRAEDGYRAWVNEDPSTRTSIAIASDAQAWADETPTVRAEVLEEDALEAAGLRLLLAVGQGSTVSPSRLVILRHDPPNAPKDEAPLMLLGKGITFDTGGINIKPYESFVSMMKNDMGGAALAYWLFRGMVAAGYAKPLLCVLPTCENSVGETAMRPGAVIKSFHGPTVRVDHTDAEGRLVLADGLSYAVDRYAPSQVISFATLTTAALIAYGPYATPVHFADSAFQGALEAASERTGEDLHFFPERIWHLEANRDKEADLRNTGRLPGNASRGAGSRNAAHFLKHFTDAPLCHLDIFASTWNWAGDAPGANYGATGAPMRTLLWALGGVPELGES